MVMVLHPLSFSVLNNCAQTLALGKPMYTITLVFRVGAYEWIARRVSGPSTGSHNDTTSSDSEICWILGPGILGGR